MEQLAFDFEDILPSHHYLLADGGRYVSPAGFQCPSCHVTLPSMLINADAEILIRCSRCQRELLDISQHHRAILIQQLEQELYNLK